MNFFIRPQNFFLSFFLEKIRPHGFGGRASSFRFISRLDKQDGLETHFYFFGYVFVTYLVMRHVHKAVMMHKLNEKMNDFMEQETLMLHYLYSGIW